MAALIWFNHQDLRVLDNPALHAACLDAPEGVIAIFFLMPKLWVEYDWSACKVDLLLRQLSELSAALASLNIPLKCFELDDRKQLTNEITQLCQLHNIDKVYANRQLLLNEMEDEALVRNALANQCIEFYCFDNVSILPPERVVKEDGSPYRVFTPFKRKWLSSLVGQDYDVKHAPKQQQAIDVLPDPIPAILSGFSLKIDTSNWYASEEGAQDRLYRFIDKKVVDYQAARDFPALDGTSQLSAYLALGVLSTRQCLVALLEESGCLSIDELFSQPGPACWLNELIWRDFYLSIAFHFHNVVKHKPFKIKTDNLPWRKDDALFHAWTVGKTGFPIVDAAMRQLNTTGWMHNRLRMIVAMFFTKTLFLDWRLGEKYFMRHLIDGDFASNNGGWQWSASTGTDAVPYFRIFNPTTQSQRFDASGEFIRQYCQEISDCCDKSIHNPSAKQRAKMGYPNAIVNYSEMRQYVISEFKQLSR